mmetsp:Transcript_58784/g.140118  ORF Transcript_58784/g.140118 Transcript_58784/m.140118 type:complete len:620 (+) Transcript_58784:68-1927(+)
MADQQLPCSPREALNSGSPTIVPTYCRGEPHPMAVQAVEDLLARMKDGATCITASWPADLREQPLGGLGTSTHVQEAVLRLRCQTATWLRRVSSEELEAYKLKFPPPAEESQGRRRRFILADARDLELDHIPCQLLLAIVEGITSTHPLPNTNQVFHLNITVNQWLDADPFLEPSKALLQKMSELNEGQTNPGPRSDFHGSLVLPAQPRGCHSWADPAGCHSSCKGLELLALQLMASNDWSFNVSGIHTLCPKDIWGDETPQCSIGFKKRHGLTSQRGSFSFVIASESDLEEFSCIMQGGAQSDTRSASACVPQFRLKWVIGESGDHETYLLQCDLLQKLAKKFKGGTSDIQMMLYIDDACPRESDLHFAAAAIAACEQCVKSLTIAEDVMGSQRHVLYRPGSPLESLDEQLPGLETYWCAFLKQLAEHRASVASLKLDFVNVDSNKWANQLREQIAECIGVWLVSSMTLQECKLGFEGWEEDERAQDDDEDDDEGGGVRQYSREFDLAELKHLQPRFQRNRWNQKYKLSSRAPTLAHILRSTSDPVLRSLSQSFTGPESLALTLLSYLFKIDEPIRKQVLAMCGYEVVAPESQGGKRKASDSLPAEQTDAKVARMHLS